MIPMTTKSLFFVYDPILNLVVKAPTFPEAEVAMVLARENALPSKYGQQNRGSDGRLACSHTQPSSGRPGAYQPEILRLAGSPVVTKAQFIGIPLSAASIATKEIPELRHLSALAWASCRASCIEWATAFNGSRKFDFFKPTVSTESRKG